MEIPAFGNLFTGQLVRLAAYSTKDMELAAARSRWTHDAEFMRFQEVNPATPRSVAYFERQKDRDGTDSFWFMIRTLADDTLIGYCLLWTHWADQVAWLGIGIGEPDYRSRGYGSDTLRLLLNYAFNELGVWKVQLSAVGDNARAIRAYEKVGFRLEVRHRSMTYRDGRRIDDVTMGVLRREWEAARQDQPVQQEQDLRS
jgi:RimJ/RimL family protein N-acetyltransferase